MLPGGIQRHGDQLARHPRADGRAAGRDSGRDRAPTPWSRPASSAPSGRGCGGWRSCRPALRGTGGCGGARAPDHLVLEAPRGPTSKPVAWWLTLQGRQSACEIRFELAHMVVEGELARLGHQVSEATVRRILRAPAAQVGPEETGHLLAGVPAHGHSLGQRRARLGVSGQVSCTDRRTLLWEWRARRAAWKPDWR